MKNRKIKVAAFYTSLHPKLKVTSSLRLAGEWLRNAGFVPGDIVAVEVTRGRLVITKNPSRPLGERTHFRTDARFSLASRT